MCERISRLLLRSISAPVLSALLAVTSPAAPGDLDRTFGVGGRVTEPGYGLYDVAVQQDGKIVSVGIPAGGSIAVVRYKIDGAPDTTFGNAGKVVIDRYGLAVDVAIQHDGKIVLALRNPDGEAYGEVLRLNPDGSPDTSFGTNGIVVAPFFPSIAAALPDGKLLVDLAANLYRLNENGSFDSTFSQCRAGVGVGVWPYNRIESVIQADGKVLTVFTSGNPGFGVFRCGADGTLDAGFGSGGVAVTPMSSAAAQSIAIQVDGKFVVAGQSRSGENTDWKPIIVRYNPNGSLDTGFGTAGIVTGPSTGITYWYPPLTDVVIQADGKILASTTIGSDFAVVRYNPNGVLDTTFGGGDGIATIDFNNGAQDEVNSMALDGRGRILVAGYTYDIKGSSYNFALARLRLKSSTPFDYDGDGKGDFSVWRDGAWYVAESGSGAMRVTKFEVNSDRIVPADYDGDGRTDIAAAVVNSTDIGDYTQWFVRNSGSAVISDQTFGVTSPSLVPADYDGDGKSDYAVWAGDISPSPWQILLSESGTKYEQVWGLPGDKPVPADFDGDGRADLAVWRPSDGKWYVANIATGAVSVIGWGLDSDIPVPGDYNGDGRADFAVYRPSNNTWYRMYSSDFSMHVTQWGLPNDVVTPGDYDGDGKQDLAVWRPSEGNWYVLTSANTIITQQFGLEGDIPTESAYVH